MNPFEFLLVRIALGERLRKATRWDYRYGLGILLSFSLSIVFFAEWLRPPFLAAEGFRLWFYTFIYGLATISFAAFCGKYVPAIVSAVAVVTTWTLHFWLG
jgi:hypothetical protein